MIRECLKIIGTAHVSEKSVEEVKNAILEDKPQVVAIELDAGRYQRLMREKSGIEEKTEISVSDIIKGDNIGLFLISGLLTYMQKKIGSDLGVKPGAEMLAAIEAAEEVEAKIALIDRDINLTLKRAMSAMSFIEKAKFVFGLLTSLFQKDEELGDIESLKEVDNLNEVMEYFKEMSPSAYKVLVDERDAFMVHRIQNIEEDYIIAVVGAGHQPGMNRYLDNPEDLPPISDLLRLEKSKIPLGKIILFSIPVIFVVIFFLAFINGIDIKTGLLEFVLIVGGFAAIGSLLSGSKIQSAVVAFLAAPLTILHPLLAAGWFSGLVEAKLRHVGSDALHDFAKAESLKDYWANDLVRVILVVIGTNLGCMIGGFITIPQVILPIFGKLLGWS
ncbi:MAG: TraB/GumN family protein [Methanobacteriaceae archaeon]|nr:TraB/GumN family protein [Methanobacteriaceae archaeon]MDP2837395.1 TraB/GumN family protein [Methanobacteriaceae archaeon]MDP3036018.1 TraB/GumN family protein [Methanobacteriaceae archaeon]MDP3485330.1 TraB/GumN family protein [Methanobacteriaceae archaeon]MDP3624197.1 TraB/GumN family protein [Methanobacteriaceae archaeon]